MSESNETIVDPTGFDTKDEYQHAIREAAFKRDFGEDVSTEGESQGTPTAPTSAPTEQTPQTNEVDPIGEFVEGITVDLRDAIDNTFQGNQRTREEIKQDRKEIKDEYKAKGDALVRFYNEKPTLASEGAKALVGGYAKVLSSYLTLPERAYDLATGEMAKQGKDYKPDWDPLAAIKDPYQATAWGNFLQMGVEYGFGGWVSAKGLARKIPGKWNPIVAEGIYGAVSERAQTDPGISTDLARSFKSSEYYNQLKKRIPFIGDAVDAIANEDYNHPGLQAAIHSLEAAGLTYAIGGVFGYLGRFLPGRKSVTKQINEAAKKQLTDGRRFDEIQRVNVQDITDQKALPPKSGFGAYKNKPVADPWQGSPAPTNKAFDIYDQLNRSDQWTGTTHSGTDSIMTPVQAQRGATTSEFTPQFLREKAKELLGDTRTNQLIQEAKKNKQSFYEVFEPAFKRYQEVMGRNATAIDAEDFWQPIRKDEPFQTGAGASTPNYQAWSMENVVAADLVNGALFKQLRNTAIAGREVINIADVFAVDGPMKTIADRLVIGLSNVKRSRYLISTEFSKLRGPGGAFTQKASKAAAERTAQLHDETVDGVRLMMQMMKDEGSDELAQGILEIFSMSNKIQNWMDFDAWMRQKIKGGEFNGSVKSGVLIKELQGVMVNSVLSGPKTPLRAILGTTSNAYLNSFNTFLGAAARAPFKGQSTTNLKAATHNLVGMFEIIPDAYKIFRTNMESYFSGDISNIKTRYSHSVKNDNWEVMGKWAEQRGTDSDKIAYNIANTARGLNDNKLLSWSSRTLAATDDTFKYIMSKARSKELGFRTALEEVDAGRIKEITPDVLRNAEDYHYNRLLDEDGNIDITKDLFLDNQFKEVTLTTELSGFSKKIESAMTSTPWAKPWFLFARTGVNGLRMSIKNSPILGAVIKESREILTANPNNLESVLKYGIESADDLAQAKNLIIGRQVLSNAVVSMAGALYLQGGLTGNGPADRQMRQMWIDTDWPARSIKIGGVWVGYDSLEPYNLLLSTIADIGDNQKLMGPQWTEDKLGLVATAVMTGATSKTYLQGLSQFVDLISGQPGSSLQSMLGQVANNTVPLGSLRNEIGKIINPPMRELSKNIGDSVRNRNLASESLTLKPLPYKHDMLNGKPIRDWNVIEAWWNTLSPIPLRMDASPGRTLLWNSNYDMRLSTYAAPNGGPRLGDHPNIRSEFQREIGQEGLEEDLNKLAGDPTIQESLRIMNRDLRSGEDHIDPIKGYTHNLRIRQLLESARERAWGRMVHRAKIGKYPELKAILDAHRQQLIDTEIKREDTSPIRTLLNKQKVR